MPAIIYLSRHPPDHVIFSPWMWWTLYTILGISALLLVWVVVMVIKEWKS